MSFLCSAAAQPIKEVPQWMNIEVAQKHLAMNDYYRALEYFEIAYKQEKSDELTYHIAMLQYKLRDYGRAERWLSRVIQSDKQGQYPDAVLAYARTLKSAGKYKEAIEAYNVYANMVEDETLLTLVDAEVEGIQRAIKSEEPIELVIKNMGRKVNSSYTEFAPMMHPEGTLYLSAINKSELVVLDGKTDDYFAQIYTTSLDRRGEWKNPKALPSAINREGYHTGNVRFSNDGNRMYFTRAFTEGDELSESKIFESKGGDGKWGAPNELANVNGDYIATHPAVGALLGNEVLFFASNMTGGEGGYDLYYSVRNDDGTYRLPVNLGPKINTPGDEWTPYFRDNVLYFSSTGHPGFGGFDIFSTEWDGTKWSEVKNLGLGYNSGYDDLYFSVNTEGTRGFIVSNRPSDETRSIKSKTCCDDIFTFEIREIVVDLRTYVYDMNKKPLENARVTLFEVVGTRTGNATTKDGGTGNTIKFLLDFDKVYKATVERDGYFPKTFDFNTVGLVGDNTIEREVFLDKAPDPETETVLINQPIRLNNIYYDFDDDEILMDAEKDLNTLLELMDTYQDMVIELSSHTDAQGSDKYNERLSQRRAQSAVEWLISRGVDPKRLVPVGYGERHILNHCVNGVQCTDAEHRVNRRTEFKIIAGPKEIQISKEAFKSGDAGRVIPGRDQGTAKLVSQTTAQPKYQLTFETPLVDFGKMKRGEKREHTYWFRNTGTEAVDIDIVSSCDCTTVTWPEGKTIMPGERDKIHAVFDSTEKEVSETVDIDIILAQTDPKTRGPVIIIVQYTYVLEQ
jgi:peptidoglycan-associated lipoprotein